MRLLTTLMTTCIAFLSCGPCHAGSGPLGIDHRIKFDQSGIWSRSTQMFVMNGLIIADVSGALWEGSDSRIGKTFWYSLDSALFGGVSAQVLKRAFSRERPVQTDNADEWFKGHGNASFPSGEVTGVTAIVTPFVLEYRHDYPLVYALELLPAYDGVARMKSHAHWQTDVIAGFALGTGISMYMHSRDTPLLVSWLPKGVSIGFSKHF